MFAMTSVAFSYLAGSALRLRTELVAACAALDAAGNVMLLPNCGTFTSLPALAVMKLSTDRFAFRPFSVFYTKTVLITTCVTMCNIEAVPCLVCLWF
jgi:hypothetical protein